MRRVRSVVAALVVLTLSSSIASSAEGLRFTVVVAPTNVYRGDQVKISGVIPNHNAYLCSESVKIYDPSGEVVSSGQAQDWLVNDDTKFKYSWTVLPNARAGSYTAKVTVVCQGDGTESGTKELGFSVMNRPPEVGSMSVRPRKVKRTETLSFDVNVTDPDGSISDVTLKLVSPSASTVSLSAAGGSASWSPPPGSELGDYDVVVRAVDNEGAVSQKTYQGAFSVENVPPKITNFSVGRPHSNDGEWGAEACSEDPDGSPGRVNLTLRVTASPGGVIASKSTSERCLTLAFSPPASAESIKVEVQALDGDGGRSTISKSFRIKKKSRSNEGSNDVGGAGSGDVTSSDVGESEEPAKVPGESATPKVLLDSLRPVPGGKMEAAFLVSGPPGSTISIWAGDQGITTSLEGGPGGSSEVDLMLDAEDMAEGDPIRFHIRIFSGVVLLWEDHVESEVPGWVDLGLRSPETHHCGGEALVEIVNRGTESTRVRLSAEFGGELLRELELLLPPWKEKEIAIPLPNSSGELTISAEPIGREDLYPRDNRITVEVSCDQESRLSVELRVSGPNEVEMSVRGETAFNYTVYVDSRPVGGGSAVGSPTGLTRLTIDLGAQDLGEGMHNVRAVVESAGRRAEDSISIYYVPSSLERVGPTSWPDIASALSSPYFLPVYAVLAAYLVRRRLSHS